MPKPDDVGVGTALFVLNEKHQILLGLRKGAHAANLWACPGGWMDREDESTEHAISREAKEECGINVTLAMPLCWTTEDHEELGVRTVTLYHVTTPAGWRGYPIVMEPHKCEEWAWFDMSDLPTNTFPGIPDAVKQLESFLAVP